MFRHILIATDGSAASQRAAASAIALAKSVGAKVTAFFAAPPATPIVFEGFLPAGYMSPQEHAATLKRMETKYLGAVEKLAKDAGVAYEGVHVTSDYPAEAIVDAAHERKCDLICMARHTRHGLAAAFVGSQTQKVVAHAKVPVLVFR